MDQTERGVGTLAEVTQSPPRLGDGGAEGINEMDMGSSPVEVRIGFYPA